jgi:hypothetical protein
VVQPNSRKIVIFNEPGPDELPLARDAQSVSAPATRATSQMPQRGANVTVDANGLPVIARRQKVHEPTSEDESAPVPVMRAQPVDLPERPQQQRERTPVARAQAVNDGEERGPRDAGSRPSLTPQPTADLTAENRPRGRGKRQIIRTRVYADGHEEREIIEEP